MAEHLTTTIAEGTPATVEMAFAMWIVVTKVWLNQIEAVHLE